MKHKPYTNVVAKELQKESLRADKMMLMLIAFHWFVAAAVTSVPFQTYQMGLLSGGALFLTTLSGYYLMRGHWTFRLLVGVVLMAFSAVYIQQNLGRIEMHFHIFVAIAFLTLYKDSVAAYAAAVTTIVHHFLFNYWQDNNIAIFGHPVYIFNYGCGYEIVLLHAVFVVLEVGLIAYFIHKARERYIDLVVANEQNRELNASLEQKVIERTQELSRLNDLFEEAQQITQLGNWEWNIKTNDLKWSDQIYRIFGLEPKSVEPNYDTFMSYVHSDDRKLVNDSVQRSLDDDVPYDIIHKLVLIDGSIKYVREQGHVQRNVDNEPERMIGTVQEITQQVRIQQELESREEQFRAVADNSLTGIVIFKERCLYVNPEFARISGYEEQELYEIPLQQLFDAQLQNAISKLIARHSAGERFTEKFSEVPLICKDGSQKIIRAYTVTIEYEEGFAGLANIFDITDIKEAEQRIRSLSQVVEQTDDIVKMTDKAGVISYVNDAFVANSGYTRREVIGKRPNLLKSGKHNDAFYDHLWSIIKGGQVFRDIIINKRKDGTLYYEEQTITPILDDHNKIVAYVSTGKDVTKRQEMEEELARKASTDNLTAIYNRHKFEEMFDLEHERAQRYGTPLTLVIFDIDHFKAINDRYGHDAGDGVLKNVALIVGQNLRINDVFARWGGEEFVILAPGINIDDAFEMAEKLRNVIESFEWDMPHPVTASFGISSLTPDMSKEHLIKGADVALYEAKANGRNRVEVLH
jgi:diguanylate cyclase (GGDEF)-like protein/PAS domain S-box-containing protein